MSSADNDDAEGVEGSEARFEELVHKHHAMLASLFQRSAFLQEEAVAEHAHEAWNLEHHIVRNSVHRVRL